MKNIDRLYSQIENKDKDTIQGLCNIFVNWTIHYAKIVYADEWMPFEEFLDNVTSENLYRLSDNAYLSSLCAPDNLAYNSAMCVSRASEYAMKGILPGVGVCMSEAAKIAKRWVKNEIDYAEESKMIRILLLENALKAGAKQ